MESSRPSICLITTALFWKAGAGYWSRTRETIAHLSTRTRLVVVFVGSMTKTDAEMVRQLNLPITFVPLVAAKQMPARYYLNGFLKVSKGWPPFDYYFIDKTENSFMLHVLPAASTKILDTHDLVSARTQKYTENGLKTVFPLSEQQERQLLGHYDAVICIQKNEYEQVKKWLGQDKSIYMPHPIPANQLPVKDRVESIGLVASRWHANVSGMQQFLTEVWPSLEAVQVELRLYGNLADHFQDVEDQKVMAIGFRENLVDCYKDIDIVINPVYLGAGLKIKTVEALSFGLPVVTTDEGASGLEELDGKGLLIAENSNDFAQKVIGLCGDKDLRHSLSRNAISYVRENFDEDVVYSQLNNFLGI